MRRFTRMLAALVVLAVAVVAQPSAAQAADVPILYHPECSLGYYPGTQVIRHAPINGVDAWQISFDNTYPYPPKAGEPPLTIDFYPGYYCQIGKAMLVQQTDGNLVLYDEYSHARWATSWLRPGRVLGHSMLTSFQSDGNLVQYQTAPWAPVWASDTYNNACASQCWSQWLAIQADGNVVIYYADYPRWSTGTYH